MAVISKRGWISVFREPYIIAEVFPLTNKLDTKVI